MLPGRHPVPRAAFPPSWFLTLRHGSDWLCHMYKSQTEAGGPDKPRFSPHLCFPTLT